jgi:hypothetical protein
MHAIKWQALGEKKVNMAALQHFFIRMMRKSATEAIDNVKLIVEDFNEKAVASHTRGGDLYL